MKNEAKNLPIYELAVKRYPHLAWIADAKHFCETLCRLAAVPGIKPVEYINVARVANGGKW